MWPDERNRRGGASVQSLAANGRACAFGPDMPRGPQRMLIDGDVVTHIGMAGTRA